ncbi:DUF3383 family protein [Enterobacter ludwigii]|uniref:DUF3383 family protein n=1 Tax=Enterobacter ludwigii TaxID=299767 RepID=UPI003BEEB23E
MSDKSIPLATLINVAISVSPNAMGTDGFGPLVFVTPQYKPVAGEPLSKSYDSMAELEADFTDGEIYKAASTYYAQRPKPVTFIVGSSAQLGSPTSATCTGGAAAVVATLQAITAGSIVLTVSGGTETLSSLNFSTITTLNDALTILNGKAKKSTFALSGSNVFSFSDKVAGSAGSVAFATGDVADALSLTSATGATISQGSDGQTMAAVLSDIQSSSKFFYFVTIDKQYRGQQEAEDAAVWCDANGKFFGFGDSDKQMLNGGDCQAAKLKAKGLSHTLLNYNADKDEYLEVAACARLATVNFNVSNSAITLAYKDMPGITVAGLGSDQLKSLEQINGNAFCNVGGNAIYLNGKMANGDWSDTTQGVDWLTNQIQVNIFNLFYQTTTKIPFTDTGVAMVGQAVSNALRLGVTNGLLAPGYDNEGKFYSKGYQVFSQSVVDLLPEKGSRIWEGTSFIAIGAGALQGVVISGTFVQ